MFGGKDVNGDVLTDLWEFNSIFLMWTQLTTSGPQIEYCQMQASEDLSLLVVAGSDGERNLKIEKFDIGTRKWSEIQY